MHDLTTLTVANPPPAEVFDFYRYSLQGSSSTTFTIPGHGANATGIELQVFYSTTSSGQTEEPPGHRITVNGVNYDFDVWALAGGLSGKTINKVIGGLVADASGNLVVQCWNRGGQYQVIQGIRTLKV